MQALEYEAYEGTLQIGIHTPRTNPVPASVYLAGTIHSEYLAKVRSALREYKTTENLASGLQTYLPAQGGFPLYGIRRIEPAGALRSVDEDFNLEVTLQRFRVTLVLYPSTFTAPDEQTFAIERIMQKAVKDCLAAEGLPYLVIPEDFTQLGETFVDIMFELGPATEQGDHDLPA